MSFVFVSRVLKTFNSTLLCSKYRLKLFFGKIPKRSDKSFSSAQFPIDNISNLKKDVLLFSYEKPRFFKFLTFLGPAQLAVWAFYGGFMFFNLRDVSESNINMEEAFANRSFWRRINLGETKYRIISTTLCLGVGILFAVICLALPSRIVRKLTLCKGGNIASVVTYGAFGKPLQQAVPLKDLSCFISRQQAKSYIAVKIKKKWFYYLIDIKGQFHQPTLFDYTIGTKITRAY